jgi:hypothetical protein
VQHIALNTSDIIAAVHDHLIFFLSWIMINSFVLDWKSEKARNAVPLRSRCLLRSAPPEIGWIPRENQGRSKCSPGKKFSVNLIVGILIGKLKMKRSLTFWWIMTTTATCCSYSPNPCKIDPLCFWRSSSATTTRCVFKIAFTILKIMLYDSEDKQLKIWACLLGTYHGLIGKLGKTW